MNLSLKYVLSINGAIVAIWVAHTYWDQRLVREEFLAAEVNAITHLGRGLRSSVEQQVRRQAGRADSSFFQQLLEPYSDFDVMLLDRDSRVLASSVRGRVGRIWREQSIDEVLSGRAVSSWKVADHVHDGVQVMDVSVAVPDRQGRPAYVVHVAKPLEALRAAQSSELASHLVFALALLLAVALVVNLLTYQILLKPLRRIQDRLWRQGWVRDRAGPGAGDEVQRLEQATDEMLREIKSQHDDLRRALDDKDRLLAEITRLRDGLADEVQRVRRELTQAQTELVRAERLSLLSRLSAGLAHELRNPLHIMRGTAETVARRHPQVQPLVEDIVEEVDRVERLVRELLDYTSPVTLNVESVNPRELLERVMHRGRTLRNAGAGAAERCSISVAEDAPLVSGDPVLLEQALLNLLTNAREAGPGPVQLCAELDPSGGVRFSVFDCGSGISEADQRLVFEPFFTRKATGTGLGLPVVQRIAELHCGSVELKQREGGGTEAVLHIPLDPAGHTDEPNPGS